MENQQAHHQQTSRQLPENVQDILANADPPIEASPDKLYDQLSSSGVFLFGKTQKFWVNKKLNCNCFMLYARSLDIAWGKDRRYWNWRKLQESSVEVAVLDHVFWLDVIGKIDTRKLSAGVMYGVSFHVMLDNSVRYMGPVQITLKFAGQTYKERQINLSGMLKGKWIEIPVAQFIAPAHDKGREIEFSLWEKGGSWKAGLTVKGASITPL